MSLGTSVGPTEGPVGVWFCSPTAGPPPGTTQCACCCTGESGGLEKTLAGALPTGGWLRYCCGDGERPWPASMRLTAYCWLRNWAITSCWLTIWELRGWVTNLWGRRPRGGRPHMLATSPRDRRVELWSAGLLVIGCWVRVMCVDWSEKLSVSGAGKRKTTLTVCPFVQVLKGQSTPKSSLHIFALNSNASNPSRLFWCYFWRWWKIIPTWNCSQPEAACLEKPGRCF